MIHLRSHHYMAYRSGNPFLQQNRFPPSYTSERMTIEGTINRTLLVLGMTVACAIASWVLALTSLQDGNAALAGIFLGAGGIGGFIMSLYIGFKRPENPEIPILIYAGLEGLFLGALSMLMELVMPGIVIQAMFGTMAVFIVMLVVYRTGLIKPTEKFVIGVTSAMFAFMLIYLFSFLGGFIGLKVPYIHSSGPIGIGFSILVIGFAALMLIVDFGSIEYGVRNGAPAKMEWYAAFGLLVTLVWIYVEILRLLAKLRDN